MGDPSGPNLNLAATLSAFNRAGVEYLLVGGQAGRANGAERATSDLDVCVRYTAENLACVS